MRSPDARAATRNRLGFAAVVALLLAALTLGSLATAGGGSKYPPGTVKLDADEITKIGKVVCGKVNKHSWLPGTLLAKRWFITHNDYAKYYKKLAKKAKGAKARKFEKKAKKLRKRAGKEIKVCQTIGGGGGGGGAGVPVQFDLSGARGLALNSPASMSAPGDAAARAEIGSSNLDVVKPNGQITDAVVSGSATIAKFTIAGNGKVYVAFQFPQLLPDGSNCVLAEIDPATSVPTCIESEVQVGWPMGTGGRPIQLDAAGAIYYLSSGGAILRRYLDGAKTDLVTDNVRIDGFLVLPDASVLISGTTESTGASWVRRVLPTGGVQTVRNFRGELFGIFPDGNVYIGFWGGDFGIRRYLLPGHQLEEKYWLSDGVGEMYFQAGDYCAPADRPSREYFCGFAGSQIKDLFTTADGKVYAVAGFGGVGTPLMQYFPVVAAPATAVKTVAAADSTGERIAIGGLTAGGQNVLRLYDPATDTDSELIGPANEIEYYHLSYIASTNKLMFDGLRFADNKYVIGEVDMATSVVTIYPTGTAKWEDFQTFD